MMNTPRFWAIIPAAGIGKRMGSEIPKQYLSLAGKTVIEHTLHRLSLNPQISEIVVVLAPNDPYWPKLQLDWVATTVSTTHGGAERCDSVLNGLQSLSSKAHAQDWVLVHDAARPCVRPGDIQLLIDNADTLTKPGAGAILAHPVKDTMKVSDAQLQVADTLERDHIWHALTPQMFRYAELRQALQQALSQGVRITDEAMAMERAGYHPGLVKGHSDNIKITQPEDLALAEFFLEHQQAQGIADFDDGMSDGG